MADHLSLLPPGSTKRERILERVIRERHEAIAEKLAVIPKLWNPATCPKEFLPYAAWALNIEIWNTTWSEKVKRQVIAAYFQIRSIRGTKEAILQAYELIGIERDRVELKEWFDHSEAPFNQPYHFTVAIKGFANEQQKEYLRRVTDKLKPLRTRFDFTLAADTTHRVRAVIVGQRVRVKRMDWNVGVASG